MPKFETPMGTINRGVPQQPRILRVPDATQNSKLQFKSSDKDFEEASALISDDSDISSNHESEVIHQDVEVSSEEIKRKMSQFSNAPLPEGSRVISPEEFNKFQKLKEEIKEKSKQLTPSNKDRIQAILGIGRKRDYIEVEGNQFWIRTLKDKEEKEVLSSIYERVRSGICKNDVESSKDFQLLYLSFALEKVVQEDKSEIPFTNLVLETYNENTVETRLAFLSELDYASIIKPLYEKFLVLRSEVVIKNKEEAQEIVDDIKK